MKSNLIKEYDERGNLIHYKDTKNTEFWDEYDDNNKLVYSRGICFVEGRTLQYCKNLYGINKGYI